MNFPKTNYWLTGLGIIFLLYNLPLRAQQDTTYFDQQWNKVADKEKASFYRITRDTSGGIWVTDYYQSGELQMEGKALKLTQPPIFDGSVTWYRRDRTKDHTIIHRDGEKQKGRYYYRNEQLKVEKFQKNGTMYFSRYFTKEGQPVLRQGNGTIVERQGNTTRHIVIQDSLITSNYRVNEATNDTIYTKAYIQASYWGGKSVLWKFIQNHLNYPDQIKKEDDRVVVRVTFIIDKNGSPANIRAQSNNKNPVFKREAKRVIGLTEWNPATLRNGQHVKSIKRVSVVFLANRK